MIQYIGEFIGTFILILVVIISKNWLFIGITLGTIILVGNNFYKVSFNPVVALAHYVNNEITLFDLCLYILIEVIATIAAYMIYKTYIKNIKNIKNNK